MASASSRLHWHCVLRRAFQIYNILVILLGPDTLPYSAEAHAPLDATFVGLKDPTGRSPYCALTVPSASLVSVRSRVWCAAQCAAPSNIAPCLGFNYLSGAASNSCQLFDYAPNLFAVQPGCAFYQLRNTPVCNATHVQSISLVPDVNCSFPFTYNGQLHYNCIQNVTGVTNCFDKWACVLENRAWAICIAPANYQAQNTTVNMTIGAGPPVLVKTVNGWIQIQEKRDSSASFDLPWINFQNGFGSLNSKYYWLGLNRIHALTAGGDFKLRVELQQDVTGLWYSAEYYSFTVANAAAFYALRLSGYAGDAKDGFLIPDTRHNIDGMKFTTFDNTNDLSESSTCNCACTEGNQHGGGWWYNNCVYGEPNGAGVYFRWFYNGTGGIVLQTSRMMVKRVDV